MVEPVQAHRSARGADCHQGDLHTHASVQAYLRAQRQDGSVR